MRYAKSKTQMLLLLLLFVFLACLRFHKIKYYRVKLSKVDHYNSIAGLLT